MNTPELLRAFLQAPELSTVGRTEERAAFIAMRLEGQTVREAGDAIGISKSQVAILAGLFQKKLAARIMELRRKRIAGSAEYRVLFKALCERLSEVANESGSNDHWLNGQKIGSFNAGALSHEDRAEAFGTPLRDPDE